MDKATFVEVLKKKGYSSAKLDEKNVPVVILVGATKKEAKKAFINVSLIAKKVGYDHSFRVASLEEADE